ncbi:hypothetical protein HYALB_00000867 [Hymenoscyphus albidus]|uniref:AA1-like domain-containing protein n=1 Tax=Hymenoscyphus albidus TaxID=595503 RepID=A0A9N9PQ36_9HELO|nr:hypothetical protein HYALB_00000867 [Hymenoscyphus albidus]
MLFKNMMVFTVLVASVLASPTPDPKRKKSKNKKKGDVIVYTCDNSVGEFDIEQEWATAAVTEGGPVEGVNVFPFIFTTTYQFPEADARCNEKDQPLLTYPVRKDGSLVLKAESADPTTPVRVAYLKLDGTTLCGVISHVNEDENGRGSGELAPCQL